MESAQCRAGREVYRLREGVDTLHPDLSSSSQPVKAAGKSDSSVRTLDNSQPGGIATFHFAVNGAPGVAKYSTTPYYLYPSG